MTHIHLWHYNSLIEFDAMRNETKMTENFHF